MTKVINLRKKYKSNFQPLKKVNYTKPKINILNTEIIKIILTILSLLSIFAGCIIYKNSPVNEVTSICNSFISLLQVNSYLEVFLYCLKLDLIYYLVMFFIGTSIVGIPLTIFPLIFKCTCIGYLSSYMYCEYELKGILFCLILLYPFFTITTTSLIYSANESIYMSKYIYNSITNKNTADNISIKLYLIRYAFLIGINISCIAVNSLLITVLANKFNF